MSLGEQAGTYLKLSPISVFIALSVSRQARVSNFRPLVLVVALVKRPFDAIQQAWRRLQDQHLSDKPTGCHVPSIDADTPVQPLLLKRHRSLFSRIVDKVLVDA